MYNGLLFTLNKGRKPFACYNMDEPEHIIQCEVRHSQKDKHCMNPLT